ncbi:hypothetical protein [Adlercreutzia sp. ZJ138]|uniref:hypothetical protein n=1 Tax=Adlercreutzia sp. ZJ138 TaxID=2709405 RepID=UPI0013EAF555|nr:hypothetical protein [Adlercreutzia sp. ZJ138]
MLCTRKWNDIMGPKDERLEAEENKAMRISMYILLIGSVLCLYYTIMLNQVASTTQNPIMTDLGASLVPVQVPLTITILIAGIVSLWIQLKSGAVSSYKRFAEVDAIPWDYVVICSAFCGAVIGALTCGMRIVAEIQIVGINQVAWFGDMAIGIVFFIMSFAISFVVLAYTIHDAIKHRRALDSELEG